MIPKILHFVWVGDDTRRPDSLIDTWREQNPDYDVRLWGNRELFEGTWTLYRHMQDMWFHEFCGVADLMRYEILHRYGGLALDADSMCVRPLPDWVIEPDDFTCWSNEVYLGQLLANGVMGAVPGSRYIGEIIRRLQAKETVTEDRAWITTGPVVTTTVWHELRYPLTIWPAHLFLPDFHSGDDYSGVGPVFARQFYGSTKDDYASIGRFEAAVRAAHVDVVAS